MLTRPALVLVLILGALPSVRAYVPQQICTVFLPDDAHPAEVLREAAAQIAAQGCEPGDALVVVGTGFEPRAAAAALCRRGAGVQISEMRESAGVQAQLDCELPLAPAARWTKR